MSAESVCGKKSICIVASTLPAAFLDSQSKSLDIIEVIVLSANLELSYRVLADRYPTIRVVCAPQGLLAQSVFFVTILLRARFNGNSIVFFHECGITILDLLLVLIKPQGFYFPQVTMGGWDEVRFDQFPRQKLTYLIRALGLIPLFKFYRSSSIGGSEPEYVMSIRNYPKSIVSKDIKFVRNVIEKSKTTAVEKSNKVLFVTGKSCVPDAAQNLLYMKLIKIAHSKGYMCLIKDHPNPVYRLNLAIEGSTSCDPLIPSELMPKDYHLVVGVTSTSLLAYDERSISLVNLMSEMLPEDRAKYVNHFYQAAPDNRIKYISTIDEYTKLL